MSASQATNADDDTTIPNPQKKLETLSLFDLKKGKVICKQKPISFEKQSETLQEIVKFREMMEMRIAAQQPPLSDFPDDHKPLVAKMVQESDKTLSALAKHILEEIMPAQDVDEEENIDSLAAIALPLSVVESTIMSLSTRVNYGLEGRNGVKPPAAVCIWRWEVYEQYRHWFPKNSREKAEARKIERVQAKQSLAALFNALPQEEQDAILGPSKGSNKLVVKEWKKPSEISSTSDLTKGRDPDPKSTPTNSIEHGRGADNEEKESHSATPLPESSKAKKQQDPEKLAKEKERNERKVAKAEKEKKEKDAQHKSRSLMANFFAKPKFASRVGSKAANAVIARPSNIQSDFAKTFKSFVLKKDAVLAPTNWFLEAKRRKVSSSTSGVDVIVIDADEDTDVEMKSPNEEDVSAMSAKDRLQSILRSLLSSAGPRLAQPQINHSQLKTYCPCSVRDMISQLSEAEIAGDDSLVRSLLEKLEDRKAIPVKALVFKEDARPGYFGTWTRNSHIIGPRSPFAKDVLIFDYAYDSGEEWEEEPAGDADDVIDDDDEDADEDMDSDLDSWLADDDEEPDILSEDRDLSPPLIDLTCTAPKRKADDGERKMGKKRKVVVPLVPFTKGPFWESKIGQCGYDTFNSFRIQLFNDTPLPINPFTFVSTDLEEKNAEDRAAARLSVVNADTRFAVPSLPERLLSSNAPSPTSGLPSSSEPEPIVTRKPQPALKYPFPDLHLPFLLNKIKELQASSIILLVELIYQELKVYKIKKNAVEAKIREVGEKCKETKIWIVKPSMTAPQEQFS